MVTTGDGHSPGPAVMPVAPGTVGTLWAWLAFAVMQPHLGDVQWAVDQQPFLQGYLAVDSLLEFRSLINVARVNCGAFVT